LFRFSVVSDPFRPFFRCLLLFCISDVADIELDLRHIYLYMAMSIHGRGVDTYLGKIYIVLSDNVERRLRMAAVVRLGGKKGVLSGAIEEAVTDWLKKEPKQTHGL
jgi:hypothetical protein